MLIGLLGNYKAGKDTVGAYLVKQHDFERRAFADPLKRSIAKTFDIPFHEVDQHKNNPNVYVAIGYKNEPEQKFEGQPSKMWSPIREMTFSDYIIHYANEGHKDVFGDNIWVDQLLPVDGFYVGRKIVITDCRFRVECDRIKSLGGKIVKINRPTHLNEMHHRREVMENLGPPDYTLENNSSMDELFSEVEEMLLVLADKEKGF